MATLSVAAAWACGGHVATGARDDGNDAGQDATTDARGPSVDAEGLDATPAHSDGLAPLSCSTDLTQGGSSGGTQMDIEWSETCNDGNHYIADCWCPLGVCCCSKNGAYPGNCGPGGSTIGDAGASYCGTTSPTTAVCGAKGWACPPPSAGCGYATFPCGGEDSGVTCEVQNDYCAIERFSPPSCKPLPSGCMPGSCSCVDAGAPPICTCSDDGGVTVACYPP